jgi:hypothetical protein
MCKGFEQVHVFFGGCWVAAQAFGFPFFEPIALQLHPTLTPDYTHGVNFAYAGATSRPDITLVPFFLQLQLDQFFVYKTAILNSARKW